MDQTFDLANALRENADKLFIPGAMLMRYGPQDYVGAVLVARGTLFFNGAHTPAVREAICQCLDQYEAIAKEQLKWLWREEPREGPPKIAYAKAKPMREMMKRMHENDHVSFAYVSGEKPEDASEWLFDVSGDRAWQAKLGWGPDALEFSLPMLYVEEHPTTFQRLFTAFARLLKVEHGFGGYAFNLSPVRKEANEPTEAAFAAKANGIDVGNNLILGDRVAKGIKTVGWLTAINQTMLQKLGGITTLYSELPHDWFALYDYGNGVVIQAGPKPDGAVVEVDPKPATYALPNHLFKELRVPEIKSLHHGSKDGEPRIVGAAAEDWLKRFDIEDNELLAYKRKLLDEPKLTKETTLPERM